MDQKWSNQNNNVTLLYQMVYDYYNKHLLFFRFDYFCINKTCFRSYLVKRDQVSFIIVKVIEFKK